jgi:hypothetical protein
MGASIDHQSFFRKNTTNLEDANLSIFGSVHFLELISRSLKTRLEAMTLNMIQKPKLHHWRRSPLLVL